MSEIYRIGFNVVGVPVQGAMLMKQWMFYMSGE